MMNIRVVDRRYYKDRVIETFPILLKLSNSLTLFCSVEDCVSQFFLGKQNR